jgi:hypothetical protein
MMTNFTFNSPPPAETMAPLMKFMQLVNKQFPIDRSIGNFQGNHSIILNPESPSELFLNLWVWKQLEWRVYTVGLGAPDMLLSPEDLLADIVRTATPELEKLITPASSLAPVSSPESQRRRPPHG